MKHILTLLYCIVSICTARAAAPIRYAGGDISLLPEYEKAGVRYLTPDGKPIAELLPYLYADGMNAMRVRLFVNPDKYTGSDKDPNACQDLNYILPLCKRIKDAGFALMLDFHYSDTWADPAKQWTPADWADMTDKELYAEIYRYTRESLRTLVDAGAAPDFIQPGNEISYGMLWGPVGTPQSQLKKTFSGSDANWARLGHLLDNAIRACREVCPDAGIVLHTERVANVSVQRNFYTQMKKLGVDYDIIGLSYYPCFHGKMNVLTATLDELTADFPDKQIMIVETGYAYKWAVPGTDKEVDYPYTDAGQNQFARELVETLLRYDNVNGLFWWWMEYNAYGTNLTGWYNAPLFDSTTGRECSALKTICSFGTGHSSVPSVASEPEADTHWFDITGRPAGSPQASGIYISRGRKIIIRQ